jgi:hypothetical protein
LKTEDCCHTNLAIGPYRLIYSETTGSSEEWRWTRELDQRFTH